MSKSNKGSIVGGGIVVALVIAGKIALKAGIFAALFGGATMANNAYQSRVDEVKREAAEFNRHNVNEQIEVDEANRVYTIRGRSSDVDDQKADLINNDPEIKKQYGPMLAQAVQQDKAAVVADLDQKREQYSNYFLISQGWKQVVTYETMSGKEWARYTITSADLN